MFERFDVPVQCSAGHLFTTIWVPMATLKSVRLGWERWQYCPVGRHWAMVHRLDDGTASADDLNSAGLVHDVRIP
jgi:hypothetical protein